MNKALQFIDIAGRMQTIGFVKSRKSDDKIHALCHEMRNMGLAQGLDIQDFIVDGSAGVDIDRASIDRLLQCLEQDDSIACVAVISVAEFTADVDDLVKFCLRIRDLGYKLYVIGEGRFLDPDFK